MDVTEISTPTGSNRLEPRIGRSVSLDHAAQLLGVSRRTVYNRIREGRPVSQGGKDHSNHRLARIIQWKRTVVLTWLVGAALSVSALVVQSLNRALPTLLLSALWVTFFLMAGLRLSSVDHRGH